MKLLRLFFITFFFLFSARLVGQTGPGYIPAVTAVDFSPSSPLINSETEAVVLFDSGATTLEANPQQGFFTKYHRLRRLLILNKKGYDEANLQIEYYAEINEGRKLKSLKASTYNLENGKITNTVVQDKDLFLENPKSEYLKLKFAFPNVRIGSIIEFEYTINRYSRDLKNWYFQTDYPVLKSIYTVQIPNIWNFVITLQNKKFITNIKRDSVTKNIYSWQFTYDDVMTHTISWTFENIPPMHEEPFTSTIDNYIGCVKFQLAVRPVQPGKSERVLNDWQWVSDRLLSSDNFGLPIKSPGNWIAKLARTLVDDSNTETERAKKIYSFVRDHFKVTSRNWGIADNSTLEKVNKDRTGNVAEINLFLLALLRSQKLEADPVILATRDNGLTNASYPVMDNYNYTICRLIAGDKIYCLDASVPTLGFGKLPTECYNGYARVITKNNSALLLSPDSIKESESIIISIENEDGKKPLNLYWTEKAGCYRSSEIRSFIKQKSVEAYIKSLNEKTSIKGKIDSFSINNLNDFEQPLGVSFKTIVDPGNEDHFYFNPLLGTGLKENPFKAAERSYPVELPYTSDKIFVLNMEVPVGYQVEELPKSTKITLNDSEGFFEYRIQKNGNTIQFRSLINITKATFEPEDYNTLKDFYAAVIKKQSELIVFKKIQR